MLGSSLRIAAVTAAAFAFATAPASAGGLFGDDCNCSPAPQYVAPAPQVSVSYAVRPVTQWSVQTRYVPQQYYVPVRTYVTQPYYVVDQGPSYNVTPVSYTAPSVTYPRLRAVTRWVPGVTTEYSRRHYRYGADGYYPSGYRYGYTGHRHHGYSRAWRGHRHGFHSHRFGHRHGFHGHRHGAHRHGFQAPRHRFHAPRAHRGPAAGAPRGAQRGPGLAGGPGRHQAGPRPRR